MRAFGSPASIKGSQALVFDQPTPSATWTINHGFGAKPTVTVTDTAGDECIGEVTHPTLNQTVITFSAPFAGTARLT